MLATECNKKNGDNRVQENDRAFHDWYRFVLSFPPHLVNDYISDFNLNPGDTLLDPFCGTGTTLVEGKLKGVNTIGLEANPMAHFASTVKLNWEIDSRALEKLANDIAEDTYDALYKDGIDDEKNCSERAIITELKTLPSETMKLLLSNSISPLPLHKSLVLLNAIKKHEGQKGYDNCLLAFASALVNRISNLRFGPEVGVGKIKKDCPVVRPWVEELSKMVMDLSNVQREAKSSNCVYLADARDINQILKPESVDGLFTSPPYPNEKDYSRTTRLESVLLGFINSKAELRAMKKTFVRSNTRSVYKEDTDDVWIFKNKEIQTIANSIEKRRIELNKDSGFERLYGRVTKLYFGGMARHLANLRPILKKGATLGYVVGDQASYLRIMIKTGDILAEIAKSLGYEHVRTDLFRTRFSTATKENLREEVVILRWKG